MLSATHYLETVRLTYGAPTWARLLATLYPHAGAAQ